MLFLYFLERFSGCCGPPLLSEYGEDTSTFTSLKYLVGLRQHHPEQPSTELQKYMYSLSSSSTSHFSLAFYTKDSLKNRILELQLGKFGQIILPYVMGEKVVFLFSYK